MEKYYEYNLEDNSKCKYNLAVSVNSCKKCLFETLCHLEVEKERRAKQEG